METVIKRQARRIPARSSLPDRIPTGWISLEWWCALNQGVTWEEALSYANPNSKRTQTMFDRKQVRIRGRGKIDVWHQSLNHVTGTYSPELIPRSNP